MKEVRPADLEGVSIAARRFEDGTLTLIPEVGEELAVVCECGRHHWLATTQDSAGEIILRLVCHSCRKRFNLLYSGPLP